MPKILSPAEQYARALRKRTESFQCSPLKLAYLLQERRKSQAAIAQRLKHGRRKSQRAARREQLILQAEQRAANAVKPVFEE